MKKTVFLALSGLGYFVLSLLLMLPVRTIPVSNYLLVLFIVLSSLLAFLFVRLCTEQNEKKAFVYAFFSGIVLWQVAGELASIRVSNGLVKQISTLNIKESGCYIYIIIGWIFLFALWKTQAVPKRFMFFAMTFLGIWSFELYMENYSYIVPLEKMGFAANIFLIVSIILSIVVLYFALHSSSDIKQLVLGGVLYLLLSIILMSAGQWRKPQSYYLKFEKDNIEYKIDKLNSELEYLKQLQETYNTK